MDHGLVGNSKETVKICTCEDDWSVAETSSVTVVVVVAQILNYIHDRYIILLCKTHYNIIVIFTYSIQTYFFVLLLFMTFCIILS